MKVIIGLVIVVLVSLYSVWPVVKNPNSVTNFGYDGVLLTWIMNQDKLFDGNIYYPHDNTLAYSDRHLLSSLSTRLPVKLSNNLGSAFGFSLVVGQMLTTLVLYVIWAKVSGNVWSAVVASIAFGLSAIRFEYQVHLQMWSMQYWLLGTWLVINYWRTRERWQVYVGGVLLGLQFWESPLPVYFATSILIIYFFVKKVSVTKHLILAAFVALSLMTPLALRYYQVSRVFNFQRDIKEAAHNAIGLDDLGKHFYSAGLFALLGVALLVQHKKSWLLVAIMVFSLLMSLGPVLKWGGQSVRLVGNPVPLPYAAAYYLIPGFNGMRTPSRWLWVAGLAGSGIIALGLSRIKFIEFVPAVLIALVAGNVVAQIKSLPGRSQIPDVYQWLKNQSGSTVLELPVYLWNDSGGREEMRMYYSLYHRKTLVNGYSGFTPPDYIDLYKDQKNNLSWPKVDYVIVAKKETQINLPADSSKIYEDETHIVIGSNN